jgi:drug/metabolite transporter (DMT)-like permease
MITKLKPQPQLKIEQIKIEKKTVEVKTGFASLFLAVFALSFAAIFIKLSERELSPVATIFNRFWIATLILGLWNGFKAFGNKQPDELSVQKQHYTTGDLVLLVLMSCFFVGTLLTWALSLTQTSVANSNLLHNITPLFTAFFGWLFLSQYFEGKFLIGMVLAIVGSISIGLGDLQVAANNFTGDSIAVLSAIFSAGNLLTVEKLRAKFSATTILLWCSFLGCLLTFPLVLLAEDKLFPSSWSGWLAVICQAVVCQVLGQVLQAHNLKKFSSSFVALFLLLDPIITAVLAWIVFSEKLNLLNSLGLFVVLIGIYVAKSSQGTKEITKYELGESSHLD